MKIVPCPHCKKPVPWTKESLYRPFCSKRCHVIDLGHWADGSYSVPSQEESPDFYDFEKDENDKDET